MLGETRIIRAWDRANRHLFGPDGVSADGAPHPLPNLILTRGARRLAFLRGEDALVMMIQAYEKLGMKELAADSQRVLQKNFPNNALVSPAGKEAGKSWWKPWQ